MKKAVIFDMDGVLIDSETFYFNRRMEFFNSIGIEPATRKFKDFVGLSDKMIWETLVPYDEKKRIELKAGYVEYRTKNKIDFNKVVNPSSQYTMKRLKKMNIKIGIASSSEKKEILRMMAECNLGQYVDFVISGEECLESKPSPEIYIRAIEALGILDKDVIAVEDSTLGIASAKAANIEVAALFQKACNLDQSQADYSIKNLKEIIELV